MPQPHWPFFVDHPALPPGEVHVWSASLEPAPSELARLEQLLSSEEACRAGRFRASHARREYVAARGILRTLLGRYLEIAPEGVALTVGSLGKPKLAEASPPLHFNLSHSHGMSLIAITSVGEVGVDVEMVRPHPGFLDLADRFFAPPEALALRRLTPQHALEAFFHAWARKEAFLKALGLGLSFGSDRVEVTLLPGEPARLLSVDGATEPAASWSLEALAPAHRYVGALALQGVGYRLRCIAWDATGE
jgi:4'-phosphopantetheinyl transferase